MASTVDTRRVAERRDPSDVFDKKVSSVARLVRESKYTVFFTGAGVSTSTGIPDYRGPSGAWTKRKIKELESKAKKLTLSKDEAAELRKFRAEQGREVRKCDKKSELPKSYLNPGFPHRAIATLMHSGLAHYCVTTNLDGLFRKAGLQAHTELCCLHGDIFTERCTSCGYEFERNFIVRNKGNHVHDHHVSSCDRCGSAVPSSYSGQKKASAKETGDEHLFAETGLVGTQDKDIGTRDTHINFGECLDDLDFDEAGEHCGKADLCIVLGTSMSLRHITHFPFMACKTVIVNLQPTPDDRRVKKELRLWGTCDEFLQRLMANLGVPELEPEHAWRPRDAVKLKQMVARGLDKSQLLLAAHLEEQARQREHGGVLPEAVLCVPREQEEALQADESEQQETNEDPKSQEPCQQPVRSDRAAEARDLGLEEFSVNTFC